jgi:aldose sugar dehydrogenase
MHSSGAGCCCSRATILYCRPKGHLILLFFRKAHGARATLVMLPVHGRLLMSVTAISSRITAGAPLLLLATFAGGCGSGESERATDATTAPPVRVEAALAACEEMGRGTALPLQVDTVATGLEVPWDLAFLPDGRILVTERGGTIRLLESDSLVAEPWAEIDVAAVAEAGLLGIDVPPDFDETGHVYVLLTHQDVPAGPVSRVVSALQRRLARLLHPEWGQVWENRVVRFSDRGNGGEDATVIVDGLPSGPLHAGGALRFGGDGSLFVGIGDGGHPPAAAEWSALRGKILRVDAEGRAAPGNPREGSPVYALGLRNPQGFDWDPGTGAFFSIDHGPTGLETEDFRRDGDELNRIVPGGDYGWPAVSGMWEGGGFETPLVEWTPAIAPAGMAFVNAPGSAWHGDVIVTGLRGRQLKRVVFARTEPAGAEASGASGIHPTRALCQETLFEGDFGRLRGVRSGPDGALYFTTSNRDQRGLPDPDDDLLLRLTPPGAPEPPG